MQRREREVDGIKYAVTREDWHPGWGRRYNLREVREGASPVVAHVYVTNPDDEQAMDEAVSRLLGPD